jgi:KipI family sensor histidine kinase inhibitor
MDLRYLISGEHSITLELGNKISEDINQQVRMMTIAIDQSSIEGVIELIPTYRSIKIDYDPCKITYHALVEKLDILQEHISDIDIERPKVIEIPTLYEGPDLKYVSEYNDISIEDVIKIHSSKEYLIYMLGFTPGFPYLGGMSEKISTPRLEKPRAKIQAGSVGIAGNQTGIYPIESPGGWQLIGRTPLKLFDYGKEDPFLLESGNYMKFVPIDKKTFETIKKQVDLNEFQVNTYLKDVASWEQ